MGRSRTNGVFSPYFWQPAGGHGWIASAPDFRPVVVVTQPSVPRGILGARRGCKATVFAHVSLNDGSGRVGRLWAGRPEGAPLKEHTLLQAIARVNRTAEGKTYGLIVDYWGVSEALQEALAIFAPADVQGAMKPKSDELPRLQTRHAAVMRVFVRVMDKDESDATAESVVDLLKRRRGQ